MVVPGYDITAANYGNRPTDPKFYPMFYGTGSADIVATSQMMADHPYAIMTDQTPVINGSDTTMDVYDCENGALTVSELGEVLHDALSQRAKHIRAQRMPLVYFSESMMSEVTGALDKAYLRGRVGLHIAHWGVSQIEAAIRIVKGQDQPYPVKGFQYRNLASYDLDVFDLEWIATSGQYNFSWTSHGQQYTLDYLASHLGIKVTGLAPSNPQAHYVVNQWMHGDHTAIIPLHAHFTYQKLPTA